MENQVEIWKAHPDIPGIEVSTLGRVRTLDMVVSSEKYTRFFKGRVLKQPKSSSGYLQVSIKINGKWTTQRVNRLVAQAFIPNPDNLPQVNHKNCVRDDNRVENLEWCTASYNRRYQEKFGISSTEARGHPLFAINLTTLEISLFRSQGEASRILGVSRTDINRVIKGKIKQAGGYYFKEEDGNGIKIDRDKLNYIVNGMRFRGGIFAVNLRTSEVSRFNSQKEASQGLGVSRQSIYKVIKGKNKSAGGYWFINDNGHAADDISRKLQEIKKIYS